MFWKNDSEKRSIDDILTPKEDIEQSDDCVVEEGDFQNSDDKAGDFSNAAMNPLDCFGMEVGKTEKWLGKCVKFWYCIMSFVWFLFGALTFAPVIYISNKVNVIFKDKKKSLLCSVLLYGFFAFLAILFLFLKR